MGRWVDQTDVFLCLLTFFFFFFFFFILLVTSLPG